MPSCCPLLPLLLKHTQTNPCDFQNYEVDIHQPLGRGFYGRVYTTCSRSNQSCDYATRIEELGFKTTPKEYLENQAGNRIASDLGLGPKVYDIFLCPPQKKWNIKNYLDEPFLAPRFPSGFIIMEKVQGIPASKYKTKDSVKAKKYCEGLKNATAKIHQRGVTHRDLHPGNVLINPITGEVVKVLDWSSLSKTADLGSRAHDYYRLLSHICADCYESEVRNGNIPRYE